MGSPAPLVTLFATYLIFVTKIGPRYMRDRKPINLTNFTRCYNIFQIAACTYFVLWGYNRGFRLSRMWTCTPNRTDPQEILALSRCNWNFIMLRLVELIETVVFVLRKKQNQVSVLHVYHHISTAGLLWLFLKYGRNEMGIYTCALNSMVHVVMYSYYFLTSFKSLRDRLQIVKPMITIIQLTQLVSIFGNTVVALLPSCAITNLYYLQILNMLVLIGFFAKFYVDNFVVKNNKKKV